MKILLIAKKFNQNNYACFLFLLNINENCKGCESNVWQEFISKSAKDEKFYFVKRKAGGKFLAHLKTR